MSTHDLKERLDRARHRMLFGFLIGFSIWQAVLIFGRVSHGSMPSWVQAGIACLGLLGWIYWGTQLFRMILLGRSLRGQPDLAAALNDEYVKEKRQKALAFALWPVLVTQGALIMFNLRWRIDAATGAQLTILVAAAGAIGAYLYLDRE